MKIELDTQAAATNIIRAYSRDGIVIRETLYQDSIIVSPGLIIEDWPPQNLSALRPDHFDEIIRHLPEIILIGTGKQLQFPNSDITGPLLDLNIGVEVMDTGAACRAYNFIAGEGRVVFAALLKIED